MQSSMIRGRRKSRVRQSRNEKPERACQEALLYLGENIKSSPPRTCVRPLAASRRIVSGLYFQRLHGINQGLGRMRHHAIGIAALEKIGETSEIIVPGFKERTLYLRSMRIWKGQLPQSPFPSSHDRGVIVTKCTHLYTFHLHHRNPPAKKHQAPTSDIGYVHYPLYIAPTPSHLRTVALRRPQLHMQQHLHQIAYLASYDFVIFERQLRPILSI